MMLVAEDVVFAAGVFVAAATRTAELAASRPNNKSAANVLRGCLKYPFGVPTLGDTLLKPPKGGTPRLKPPVPDGFFNRSLISCAKNFLQRCIASWPLRDGNSQRVSPIEGRRVRRCC